MNLTNNAPPMVWARSIKVAVIFLYIAIESAQAQVIDTLWPSLARSTNFPFWIPISWHATARFDCYTTCELIIWLVHKSAIKQ